MKLFFIVFCLVAFSAKGQTFNRPVITDTVVVFISNETTSTWWRHVDHNPFPRVLVRVREFGAPVRYKKKLRRGWAPLPSYYKVWNN